LGLGVLTWGLQRPNPTFFWASIVPVIVPTKGKDRLGLLGGKAKRSKFRSHKHKHKHKSKNFVKPSQSPAMKLLLSLLSLISLARGDVTYVTVVYGNSVPRAVRQEIAASTDELLGTLNETTPASFDVVAAGEPIARDRELYPEADRKLPDFGCPNSCSNSGSNYCRVLGCANCGNCGGRRTLRGLQDATFDAVEVELALTEELSTLCDNATAACELWTVVYIVNADGSLTEAAGV
jgi:hypothetical protein